MDGKAFGAEMVDVVKSYLERTLSPALARIAELETRFAEIQLKEGPAGKDGRDGIDGKDGEPGAPGVNGIDGAPGRDGIDGKDGIPGEKGIDGRDGIDGLPGKDGQNGINGTPGEKGEAGSDGRDGVGLAGALIDRSGGLVVTLTDGTTRALGLVVGKDADMPEIERMIAEKVAMMQPPEIERDAHMAMISKMIEDARQFAPDDVAENISLAVKMAAARPAINAEPETKGQTINIMLPRPGAEKVQVTEHSADGRIKSYVKTPIGEA